MSSNPMEMPLFWKVMFWQTFLCGCDLIRSQTYSLHSSENFTKLLCSIFWCFGMYSLWNCLSFWHNEQNDSICSSPIYSSLWMRYLLCHMVLSIALHTTSLWLIVAMAFIRRMTLKNPILNRYCCLLHCPKSCRGLVVHSIPISLFQMTLIFLVQWQIIPSKISQRSTNSLVLTFN